MHSISTPLPLPSRNAQAIGRRIEREEFAPHPAGARGVEHVRHSERTPPDLLRIEALLQRDLLSNLIQDDALTVRQIAPT